MESFYSAVFAAESNIPTLWGFSVHTVLNNSFSLGLFSDLINNSNDMIFIINVQSFAFEYINQTACDELGYSFDEMQALGIEGFRRPLNKSESFSEHIDELRQAQNGMTDYAILLRKDGSQMHIEAKVRIIHANNQEYDVAMVRDISERVRLVEELKEQARKTQNYLDIAQVIILALDKNRDVMMINQAGADLLGYSKEEMIGKNWIEHFLPESDRPTLHTVGEDILHKKDVYSEYENPVLTKSGEERLIAWKNTALLDAQGNAVGILSSGEDITDKREAEKKLLLHSKQAQMGEMINMIAHQWRQPLATIASVVGAMQLNKALQTEDETTTTAQLESIENLVQHLSRTIDDFRYFFKEDKEQVIVTLSSLIEGAVDIIKPVLTAKGIRVSSHHLCDEKISTYPNEVKQVILNLLKNSQEVLEERKIKYPQIEITSYKENENFCIEIKDNGGGISDEIIDKIFDPYFTTKDEYNGTGLGLYMSKTIIQEHCKAEIEARNSDKGALFLIRMKKSI